MVTGVIAWSIGFDFHGVIGLPDWLTAMNIDLKMSRIFLLTCLALRFDFVDWVAELSWICFLLRSLLESNPSFCQEVVAQLCVRGFIVEKVF